MAKMRRDTAKRSLQDLFRNLPASAVIHLTRRGTPPPNGVGAIITIEIAAPPTAQLHGLPGGTRIETAAKAAPTPAAKPRPTAPTPAAKPRPTAPTPADPTPTGRRVNHPDETEDPTPAAKPRAAKKAKDDAAKK